MEDALKLIGKAHDGEGKRGISHACHGLPHSQGGLPPLKREKKKGGGERSDSQSTAGSHKRREEKRRVRGDADHTAAVAKDAAPKKAERRIVADGILLIDECCIIRNSQDAWTQTEKKPRKQAGMSVFWTGTRDREGRKTQTFGDVAQGVLARVADPVLGIHPGKGGHGDRGGTASGREVEFCFLFARVALHTHAVRFTVSLPCTQDAQQGKRSKRTDIPMMEGSWNLAICAGESKASECHSLGYLFSSTHVWGMERAVGDE